MNGKTLTTLMIAIALVAGAGMPLAGADTDPIPDPAEAIACGSPDVRDALDDLGGTLGECEGADYVPPEGVDDDLDRFPDVMELVVCGSPFSRGVVASTFDTFGHACPSSADYSPPTTNATLLLPMAAQAGADLDLDGFPTTVTFSRLSITVRPFGTQPMTSVGPGPDQVVPIDSNDGDPNVPAVSIVTVPTPVPTGQLPTVDEDRDGFPVSVTLTQSTVSFDRRQGTNAVTLSPAAPIVTGIDPNDGDPNAPLVSIFTVPVPVPTGIFSLGADADRDGFPTTVTLNRADVTFDRRSGANAVTLTPAASVVQAADTDDADPNVPATSIITLPAPVPTFFTLGADSDGDDVPSTATVTRSLVTFDRRGPTFVSLSETTGVTNTIDPNDADANTPAASTFGPVKVATGATHSPDGDDDYAPHHVTVSFLDVTIDRRSSSANHLVLGGHTEQTVLDADDSNRGDPVPFDVADADADLTPDAAEPWICQFQNENFGEDGTCGTPDGSDLTDYTPPVGAPNPWDML